MKSSMCALLRLLLVMAGLVAGVTGCFSYEHEDRDRPHHVYHEYRE